MRFTVELPGAYVLFSTRQGGVSTGPYESLNLGLLTGDERERVIANRLRLSETAGVAAENVAMGWQVHGSEIREWNAPDPARAFVDPGGGHLKVDGHVVRRPDMAALVLVADCLPVAIAGRDGVALLHCGWRGLAAGIITAGARRLEPVAAAVGPGIGPCCYEVGEEVLEAFAGYDGVSEGRMLNLRAIADAQLRAAGIDQIEHIDLCTSCREDLFFSHRRDNGVTGRQGGMAWPTA